MERKDWLRPLPKDPDDEIRDELMKASRNLIHKAEEVGRYAWRRDLAQARTYLREIQTASTESLSRIRKTEAGR